MRFEKGQPDPRFAILTGVQRDRRYKWLTEQEPSLLALSLTDREREYGISAHAKNIGVADGCEQFSHVCGICEDAMANRSRDARFSVGGIVRPLIDGR